MGTVMISLLLISKLQPAKYKWPVRRKQLEKRQHQSLINGGKYMMANGR